MDFTVVIPARYQSSRFPGKPLANIQGKPMVQHVVECSNIFTLNAIYYTIHENKCPLSICNLN